MPRQGCHVCAEGKSVAMAPGANNIEVNVQQLGTALCLHFSCCVTFPHFGIYA